MQNLDLYYVRAKNFRCFGPEGIELDFRTLGRIVVVKGKNLDRQNKIHSQEITSEDDEDVKSRNGVGKSSIPEIITYALFGETLKKSRNMDVPINNRLKKGLEVEVRWGKYRVVRKRKPNELHLWESEDHIWDDSTKKTLGSMDATQEEINKAIKISFQTFVNTVVFTDRNKDNFLECDTPTKRQIVENLLSLGDYTQHNKTAKNLRNKHQYRIDSMAEGYERMLHDSESAKQRVTHARQQEANWKVAKKKEIEAIIARIKATREKLTQTDIGAALVEYNEAQERIVALNESLLRYQESMEKVSGISKDILEKLTKVRKEKLEIEALVQKDALAISAAQTEVKRQQSVINAFTKKEGTKCPSCLGVVKKENFAQVIEEAQAEIDRQMDVVEQHHGVWEVNRVKEQELAKSLASLENAKAIADKKTREINGQQVQARNQISELAKIEKPEAGTDQRLLESQIEQLKQQALAKKQELDGPSPYVEIIKAAEEDVANWAQNCTGKKQELEELEKELPYFDFWVKAFGDKGIRKFVIDGIVPALNSRVAYWLQFLFDGKMKLTFDNELSETIEEVPAVEGDPYVYNSLSGGEQRRLNLSISQAFAYVMMLNSGVSIPVVFLDEVSTNVDPVGVEGIFNMIVELAKTKQVFVTTHDQGLLEFLAGFQCINLVRKDGFTKLA